MNQLSFAKNQVVGVRDHVWDAAYICLPEKIFTTVRIRRSEWKLYSHRVVWCGISGPRIRPDINGLKINIRWRGKMHEQIEARKLALVNTPAPVAGTFTCLTLFQCSTLKFRYYPICTYEKLRCKKDSPKAKENSGNCEKKDLSTELSNSLFFFTL